LISDNYSVLINNYKINSNAIFDAQYNIRLNKGVRIRYLSTDASRLHLLRQNIENEKDNQIEALFNDSLKAINDKFYTSIKLNILSRDIKNNLLKKRELDSILRILIRTQDYDLEKTRSLYDSCSVLWNCIDSLLADSLKLTFKIDSLDYAIENSFSLRNSYKKDINERFNRKLQELESGASITGINYGWLSFLGGFSRKQYHSYNASLSFDNQVQKNSKSTSRFGLSYNYYWESSFPRTIWYANVGLTRFKDNNTSLLSTQEIIQNYTYKSSSEDSTRVITRKFNAYTEPIFEYTVWELFANFYLINSSKTSAFHVFPSVQVFKGATVLTSFGMGYVFSFKNTKKNDKAVLNAELYVLLQYPFDPQALNEDIWSKNSIGVRLSLPFYFLK